MSIKILLADDSITIQKVIGIIFGGEEYSLTVVDNGKAALDKAREVVPDVLLIDALMPGMSGYEVCEAIRATPALAQKPILLLTGSFEPFDEERARSCGADDILAKPFESQQIVSKVRELHALGAARATAAPSSSAPPAMPAEPPAAGEPVEEATADDIWGAFTTAPEPAPVQPVMPEPELGPDVFAIISEEPEALVAEPATPSESTGSQWIPVEEQTFEFEEDAVAELPVNAFSGLEPPDQAVSFGDHSFEAEAPAAAVPEAPPAAEPLAEALFTEIPFTEEPFAAATPAEEPLAEPFAETAPPLSEPPMPEFGEPAAPMFEAAPGFSEPRGTAGAPAAETAPATLTEAQLKAAVAAVSREVIERIVWEVVPDLAETLIKEAIRKIREGQ